MNQMSIQEMSSLLFSRIPAKKEKPVRRDQEPPHRHWNETERAALVILWGLLVYPKLDPDLREEHPSDAVYIDQLVHMFQDVLGNKNQCHKILAKLQAHDYIRFRDETRVIPGTGLFAAVDAAKMYKYFRSSVLSRKIFQLIYSNDYHPEKN
ncbi:hypothetical protein [Thermoactinomyces mirandus]|uniref:Uncharacterized protein n=1 Tax=Thermoactinomyces mirandus TaxID=2756294 RepID=A0A7W1XQJ5_9BACL|nr:hypothetical protein [Thermoactinomyces mirandus]MBA4601409.1 hypothetical protein [Thermoactinomyces mirandus]